MVGRILHSRDFLLDLRVVLETEAPVLLDQPIAHVLRDAWDLCEKPDANDYDPRLRNGLGTVAQILDCDIGPMRRVSELPMSVSEALDLFYHAGNRFSLAEYLTRAVGFLFTNKNVERVDIGPVGEPTALDAHIPRGKNIWLNIAPDYDFEGSWLEAELTVAPDHSSASLSKEFFRDYGLEFFHDFARTLSDRPWIAFLGYRLALGKKELVSPWVPLPYWK